VKEIAVNIWCLLMFVAAIVLLGICFGWLPAAELAGILVVLFLLFLLVEHVRCSAWANHRRAEKKKRQEHKRLARLLRKLPGEKRETKGYLKDITVFHLNPAGDLRSMPASMHLDRSFVCEDQPRVVLVRVTTYNEVLSYLHWTEGYPAFWALEKDEWKSATLRDHACGRIPVGSELSNEDQTRSRELRIKDILSFALEFSSVDACAWRRVVKLGVPILKESKTSLGESKDLEALRIALDNQRFAADPKPLTVEGVLQKYSDRLEE
jgi:hypothetical protein